MWKVYFSRYLNMVCGGNPNEMLSSRMHNEGWWQEVIIDTIFFWQDRHCERCARWERRFNGQKNSQKAESKKMAQPPHQDEMEAVVSESHEGAKQMTQLQMSFMRQTSCAHCHRVISQSGAVIRQYYDGQPGMVSVEHFCSEEHHQLWYLDRLRRFDQQ